MSDQVLHPYQTTDKIKFLYISVCAFLDRKFGRQTRPWVQSALNLFINEILLG
jgi:hypothetical protein